MAKDRLEHFINNSVGEYESPINTDELWANIQGSIPPATANKTAGVLLPWKWIGLGAILLLSVGAATFFLSYETVDNTVIGEWNAEEHVTEAIIETSITSAADITEVETTETSLRATGTELTNADLVTSTPSTRNTATQKSARNASSSASTVSVVSTNNIAATQGIKTVAQNKTVFNENIEQSTTDVIVANDENINVSIQEEVESISDEQVQSVLAAKSAERTRALVNTEFAKTKLSLLSAENQLANSIGLPDKVTCPSFGGRKGRGGVFVGELQAIPYYSIPQIKAQTLTGEEWKSRKEATESYLEAFQINLVGRYQMRNGLYLQGGIGYGQIDEKFEFNSSDIQVTTENDLPVIIILRPNGSSDTIRQPGEVTTETTFMAETYNYHRMIELPFAIGYEFSLNNSMGLYMDFGGSINLSTFRKGYHIVDDVDVITFDDETRPVFKTTTGFKINGSMGLRYYTPGGVSLSVGPDIRYHMSNWIRDEHPIELRYLDIGIRLGVGYTF